MAGAAAGSPVSLLYDGPASFGTSNLVTNGNIAAAGTISANGAGIATLGNTYTGGFSSVSGAMGDTCNLIFTGGGATTEGTATVALTGANMLVPPAPLSIRPLES